MEIAIFQLFEKMALKFKNRFWLKFSARKPISFGSKLLTQVSWMGYYGKLAKHGGFQVISGNYLDFQVFGGGFWQGFSGENYQISFKNSSKMLPHPTKISLVSTRDYLVLNTQSAYMILSFSGFFLMIYTLFRAKSG